MRSPLPLLISKVIHHLDCSLRFRPRAFFLPALLASGVALLTGVAVAYRTEWCQVQALAVILLVGGALLWRERERRERVEYGIKQQNIVYCLNCRRTSQIALAFGSRVAATREESTAYEKLFVPVFSVSVLLLGLAAWIAYGALFHEGAHEAAEMKAIEVLFGFSDTLPRLISSARVLLLFGVTILSLFLSQKFALVHAGVVFLCALLPPASATPQALSLSELTARIALYCTLFIVAETFEMSARHCAWLRCTTTPSERNTILLAFYCASKGDRGTRPLVDTASTSIDVFSEIECGRDYSVYRSAARLTSALRSVWILLVSSEVAALGVLQVLLMLALLARERKILSTHIADNRVRLVHLEGEPVRSVHTKRAKECHTASAITSSMTTTTTTMMTATSSVVPAPSSPISAIARAPPASTSMLAALVAQAPQERRVPPTPPQSKTSPTPVQPSVRPPTQPLVPTPPLGVSRSTVVARRTPSGPPMTAGQDLNSVLRLYKTRRT